MSIITTIGGTEHPEEQDEVRLRIEAKQELWAFLADLANEIENYRNKEEQLVKEISAATVKFLHPYFEATELQSEVENVINTLQVREPGNFSSIHASSVVRELMKKMS